jgi:hypothetical protein
MNGPGGTRLPVRESPRLANSPTGLSDPRVTAFGMSNVAPAGAVVGGLVIAV